MFGIFPLTISPSKFTTCFRSSLSRFIEGFLNIISRFFLSLHPRSLLVFFFSFQTVFIVRFALILLTRFWSRNENVPSCACSPLQPHSIFIQWSKIFSIIPKLLLFFVVNSLTIVRIIQLFGQRMKEKFNKTFVVFVCIVVVLRIRCAVNKSTTNTYFYLAFRLMCVYLSLDIVYLVTTNMFYFSWKSQELIFHFRRSLIQNDSFASFTSSDGEGCFFFLKIEISLNRNAINIYTKMTTITWCGRNIC